MTGISKQGNTLRFTVEEIKYYEQYSEQYAETYKILQDFIKETIDKGK